MNEIQQIHSSSYIVRLPRDGTEINTLIIKQDLGAKSINQLVDKYGIRHVILATNSDKVFKHVLSIEQVIQLTVTAELKNIQHVSEAQHLVALDVQAIEKCIDVSKLMSLKVFAVRGKCILDTELPLSLEELSVIDVKSRDLSSISRNWRLRVLNLERGSLETTDGLEKLQNLTNLSIKNLPALSHVYDMEKLVSLKSLVIENLKNAGATQLKLPETLEFLRLEDSIKFSTLNFLADKSNLQHLSINVASVESLHPIKGIPCLKKIFLNETKVLDNDTAVLNSVERDAYQFVNEDEYNFHFKPSKDIGDQVQISPVTGDVTVMRFNKQSTEYEIVHEYTAMEWYKLNGIKLVDGYEPDFPIFIHPDERVVE
jgi:hypothetical protein